MPTINCPSRIELDSFQAGNLEEPRLSSLELHVESCSTCQRAMETVIGESADPVLAALLEDAEPDTFATEASCRTAVERVTALARELVASGSTEATIAPAAANEHGAAIGPLPVESIREYKLLAKLGEGGMGAVYKALHTRLDKVVALKILPTDRMRDTGAVARFQREMKAVGKLDHPNIVRAMDAGEEAGLHFLVMEYVEGLDLSQLAKNTGPLPIADACELVRQAALGLAEAHEHGMVHRDIKPSNLILAKPRKKKTAKPAASDTAPTVRILDLGLALLSEALAPDAGGLTTSGQMMGTIDYMAPEQGGDSHQVDIRADIYSLGATLYRLLTGAPPFAGDKFDTPVKKILALATQSPSSVQARRPDVPAPLAAIIDRMLAKDPAQRFSTPEELADAIAPFCKNANLAALFARASAPSESPTTPASEIATREHLSSPSGDTAPTIDRAPPPLARGGRGAEGERASGSPVNRRALAASAAATAGLGAWVNRAAMFGRKIPRPFAIAAACGGAALAALLGVIFFLQTPDGTVRIEINDPDIKVVIDNDGKATFTGADKRKIVLKPGPHSITITRGDLTFGTTSFELKKGEKPVLRIDFLDGQVHVTKDNKALPAPTIVTVSPPGWHGWPADAPPPAIAPFDAAQAKVHQEAWAKYLGVPAEYENSIGMKFRLIPPGEFMMGSTPEEIEQALPAHGYAGWRENVLSEGPQHKVILTKPIYLGATEVTQAQYEQVMGTNPSHFSAKGNGKELVADVETKNHPVEMVRWHDAADFCTKLSQQEEFKPFYRRTESAVTTIEGTGYRLPTEAEWEFSCRAGTMTRYWIGDSDEELTHTDQCSAQSARYTTRVVGKLMANPFGLFDVHGNVMEWVQDSWDPAFYATFAVNPAIDPVSPVSAVTFDSPVRVLRGGYYQQTGIGCRSSFRRASASKPSQTSGFRVVLVLESVRSLLKRQPPSPDHPATPSLGARNTWHGWPADAPLPAIAPFDAQQAKVHQEAWAKYLGVPVEYENSIGMKFRLIPPGEFLMGSPPAEIEEALKLTANEVYWQNCIKSEGPQRKVILTQPLYLGLHEVTQAEYERVMGTNPSFFAKTGSDKKWVEKVAGLDTASHPVEGVSWNDCAEFCAKLSALEKLKPFYSRSGETVTLLAGTGYRLPSEAHWEFACRAGTTTRHWSGDTDESLVRAAWFIANSGERTHAVGELAANPFGLFDIQGNVWEWVEDGWYYGQFQDQPAINPSVPPVTSPARVYRGGIWYFSAPCCRAAFRHGHEPDHRARGIGLRVALPVDAVRESTGAGGFALELNSSAGFALEFDGADDVVEIPTLKYDGSYPITIEAWATPSSSREKGYSFVVDNVDDTFVDGQYWPAGIGLQQRALADGAPNCFGAWVSTSALPSGQNQIVGSQKQWSIGRSAHLALQLNGGRAQFYINGQLIEDRRLDESHRASNKHFVIGKRFGGRIREVRVSNAARYTDNFTPDARFVEDKDTLALYHMGEGQGDVLTDSSGNNHHGKIVGAKWVRSDAPPAAGTAQVVDLLKLWDFKDGVVNGKWTRTEGGVAVDGGAPFSRIKLPYAAPREYDFRVEFTAQGGNDILQIFPVGERTCTWLMGAWGGKFDGFDTVKDHPLTREGTNIIGGPTSIRRGQRHTSVVQVRRDYIAALIDGKEVVRHATDGSDLGIPSEWSIGKAALGLGSTFDAVTFHKVELVIPKPANSTARWHGWPADAPPPAIAPFDAAQAKQHQEAWANYLGVPAEWENSLGMKFRLIPPGEFLMGSTPEQIEAALKAGGADYAEQIRSEGPQHKVILTQPIYLGAQEVRQGDYEQVIEHNPSRFAAAGTGKEFVAGLDPKKHPVEMVSWNEAIEFCTKLSEKEQLQSFGPQGETVTANGTGYRLPSEAEWEFACRAGTTTNFWTGDADDSLALAGWIAVKPLGRRTHAVGELEPNPLGLFDVHGNVWEWIADRWEPDYFQQFADKPALDPKGATTTRPQGLIRGGGWDSFPSLCRAATRYVGDPKYRNSNIGFRVALGVDAVRARLLLGEPVR